MSKRARLCEVCREIYLNSHHVTICIHCDAVLARKAEAQEVVAKFLWGLKHKCRRCKAPLSPDRYFDCVSCVPNDSRETAWEFDSFEDMDVSDYAINMDLAKEKLQNTEPKTCAGKGGCGETKPRSEFYVIPKNKDGFCGICKACCLARVRAKREEKRKAAQNEVRAL